MKFKYDFFLAGGSKCQSSSPYDEKLWIEQQGRSIPSWHDRVKDHFIEKEFTCKWMEKLYVESENELPLFET